MVKVVVKWNKEKYEVDVDPTQNVECFKTQLFSLTCVPVERQKIMGFKGGILKDDAQWKDLDLTEGKNLMLVGSAVELQKPEKPIVFLEDLPASKAHAIASSLPAGLSNLGNTCYLNSTVQCLKNVPELLHVIKQYKPKNPNEFSTLLKTSQTLFGDLVKSHTPISPFMFLTAFRTCFPQFAERGKEGFLQQDAEEAWSQLLTAYSHELPLEGETSHSSDPVSKSVIGKLFGIQAVEKFICKENPSEEPTFRKETLLKLACNITIETSYLLEGLKKGLEEEITKRSDSLGREAIYTKKTQISVLPQYLTVQFVRFHWKDTSKTKAKIVRTVQFPFTLDLFDLCTPEFQAQIAPNRKIMEDEFNKGLERKRKGMEDKEQSPAEKKPDNTNNNSNVDSNLNLDPKPNETGKYELIGVLTHQGRYAESGHYVAWVKKAEDQWLKFDDSIVTECNNEEIKKLSGGGDWHMAYMCLYKAIPVPKVESDSNSTTTTTTTSN
ncbi:hypothetical protein CYY_004555 [Polysphondylium violaceum]|uniref:Ubiquitin carboxyl-terminal hydrolase n=1 Tax=Polysphondylium violaceum TaxID=133409 RepID=A0A8J4PV05_9MYCE|nr:hypothetical protein CYY_004555 [Polysphondylium violaceum]